AAAGSAQAEAPAARVRRGGETRVQPSLRR
ncbi:hypothetical protein GA0115259_111973, partial [Streptomyces sp. MnatMP-M17]